MKRYYILMIIAIFIARTEVLGINARSIGMGEAFTAIVDDSNAVFYNPAGIVFQERLAIDGGTMLDDSYSYLLGGFIIPSANIGFGYTDFSYPSMYKRNTMHASLGIKMSKTFAVGISGKNTAMEYDDIFLIEDTVSTNADVGFLVKTDGFSMGLLMTDILESSDPVIYGPLYTSLCDTRAGICLGGKEFKFAIDYWAYSDDILDITGTCFGIEYMMKTGVGLRIGGSAYNIFGMDMTTINMGISMITAPLVIHYAIVTPYLNEEIRSDLSDHYISVGIRFGSNSNEEISLMGQYP